jgi:hypothetical protein
VIDVRDRLARLLLDHGFSRFSDAVGVAHER